MKPLHERLRELPQYSFIEDLGLAVGIGEQHDDELMGSYFDKLIVALADEIERCYIPLPIDQAGKPWRPDEDCVYNGHGYSVAGFDGEDAMNLYDVGSDEYIWAPTSRVVRPAPKVLDADFVDQAAALIERGA